jgi:hypothetical protein
MGLELSCIHSINNNSLSKFAIKHVISALALSKATKSSSEKNRDKNSEEENGKMAEPLTNHSRIHHSLDTARSHQE